MKIMKFIQSLRLLSVGMLLSVGARRVTALNLNSFLPQTGLCQTQIFLTQTRTPDFVPAGPITIWSEDELRSSYPQKRQWTAIKCLYLILAGNVSGVLVAKAQSYLWSPFPAIILVCSDSTSAGPQGDDHFRIPTIFLTDQGSRVTVELCIGNYFTPLNPELVRYGNPVRGLEPYSNLNFQVFLYLFDRNN